MFLKRGIFVNWGNIPQLEFEFGPVNLFSGGNGSGKTTAADAIQSLMTAAHENLFTYNPGQDETTQRGRGGKQVRTLASYVLGCDDGSYARPWATDAYVSGIFHPTTGESADPFTAVMCMRAHLDRAGRQSQARLDELFFIIVPGEELNAGHFVKRQDDGKHVVSLDQIAIQLKKRFGAAAVEVYDKKSAYLRRLYAALRGRRDAVSDREAKHAARTFANFMAYKPVKSIHDFVAREILEPRDLGDAIRNVSDLMKTIHQMESETRAIRETIDTLAGAAVQGRDYLDAWVERQLMHYTEATRRLHLNQQEYLTARKTLQGIREALADNAERVRQCARRREQCYNQRVELEAQRKGISALKTKDELEQAIREHTAELGRQAKPLLEAGRQLTLNQEAARELLQGLASHSLAMDIPALESRDLRRLLQAAGSNEESTELDFGRLLAKDWVGLEQLEQDLDGITAVEASHRHLSEALHGDQWSEGKGSIRDQLALVRSACQRRGQERREKYLQKQKEIQLLESRQVSYPPYVEAALAAIAKTCPKADPRVLCDYVEVIEPQWQMAIEGYIGGARFSILVEPEYEAEAIRVVRAMPGGRRNRARVIQGDKARRDGERLTLPRDSIIDVMSFSHKTAEYYLRASYGSVLRVPDAEALRGTPRGVTPDGLGSGNYSMWRCDLDDGELVFGQGARERALRAKERECEQLGIDVNQAEQEAQWVSRLFEQVESIRAVACGGLIRDMLDLQRRISQAETALERLDLSGYEELEEQLAQLNEQYREQEALEAQLTREAGALEEKAQRAETDIRKLADTHETLQAGQEDFEQAVQRMAGHHPQLDVEQAMRQADDQARQAGAGFSFNADVERLTTQLDTHERCLYQAVMSHNQHCRQGDTIIYEGASEERHDEAFFRRIVNLCGEIDTIHNRLRNNVLVDKYDKLENLKDSFNTAFVTNLCHSIYQAICDGKRVLEDLNRELEHHRFGSDRERFHFGFDWVPEYYDYWRFFKEVIDAPDLGDGASLFEAKLSDKAAVVRDRMLDMLLDPDEQHALRELGRISDYRNYRRYEIYKEPEGKAPIPLSEYGTGSGGQLETPAYIIRSAAVTSAFRFGEGDTHLRMVLVDEAFSKMDETRSREVIHYLCETLGLQLVFIMPTSKSGPFMDLISNQFVFSKCPSNIRQGELNTRVLVDRKTCNQEKISQLWANHRKTIRNQAMLDFMEGLEEEEGC